MRARDAAPRALGQAGDLLRQALGEAVFTTWFQEIEFVEIAANIVRLSAPSDFVRSRIATNYLAVVLNCWKSTAPMIERVEIIVRRAEIARS